MGGAEVVVVGLEEMEGLAKGLLDDEVLSHLTVLLLSDEGMVVAQELLALRLDLPLQTVQCRTSLVDGSDEGVESLVLFQLDHCLLRLRQVVLRDIRPQG